VARARLDDELGGDVSLLQLRHDQLGLLDRPELVGVAVMISVGGSSGEMWYAGEIARPILSRSASSTIGTKYASLRVGSWKSNAA